MKMWMWAFMLRVGSHNEVEGMSEDGNQIPFMLLREDRVQRMMRGQLQRLQRAAEFVKSTHKLIRDLTPVKSNFSYCSQQVAWSACLSLCQGLGVSHGLKNVSVLIAL